MAFSAHSDPEMMKERNDSSEELEKKIIRLAKYIKTSKHFIIYTGAGISTSAGIPDFRGPQGVWTLKAQGKKRTKKTVDSLRAVPTTTHMSIVALQQQGICKYLISQNCDGLHKRSGIKPNMISELHGNGNIEYCEDCGKIRRGRDHYTGRHCVVTKEDGKVCNGRLHEYTIDFGQNLPVEPMEKGFANAEKADLCLVLGSSCTVNPAAKMPKRVAKRGKVLIICNLQKTALYNHAKINIHAPCDVVMKSLMEKLEIPIPTWELKRKIEFSNDVEVTSMKEMVFQMNVKGVDFDEPELPASIIRAMKIVLPKQYPKRILVCNEEPYVFREKVRSDGKSNMIHVKCEISFMGWYYEPNLRFEYNIKCDKVGKMRSSRMMSIAYRPDLRKWRLISFENLLPEEKTEVTKEKVVPKEETMKSPRKNVQLFIEKLTPKNMEKVTPRIWGTSSMIVGGDGRKYVVLIGGASMNKMKTNPGIDYYDLERNSFLTKKIVVGKGKEIPFANNKARWGHSASVVGKNKVYLIGGFDHQCQFNDVHLLEDGKISRIKTSGQKMSYRAMHSAVVVGKNIICFGGAYCAGGPYEHYNDVFVFNTEKCSWRKLSPGGDVPLGRSQHSSVLIGSKMYIFGGLNSKQTFSDVYVLDLEKLEWNKIEVDAGDNREGIWKQEMIEEKEFRITPTRASINYFANDDFIIGGKVVICGKDGFFCYDSGTNKFQKIGKANEKLLNSTEKFFSCHSSAKVEETVIFMVNGKNEVFRITVLS